MSRIVSLTASNFMRLRAVHIRPKGANVLIRGGNEQGKSSVLNAIWAALGGKEALYPVPVRQGEEQAEIKLELTDYVITRTIKADRTTSLIVRGHDGSKLTSPQTMLNKLLGDLSFDPMEFARLEKDKRDKMLEKFIGVDFGPLDAERQAKYDARTEIGKEARRLEGEITGVEFDFAADVVELDPAKLVEELQALTALRESAAASEREAVRLGEQAAQCDRDIVALQEQIKGLQERVAKSAADASSKRADAERIRAVLGGKDIPGEAAVAAVRDRIASVGKTNEKVRTNKRHLDLQKRIDEQRAHYQALSERIAEIDAEKSRQLRDATYPLPTLRLTESGVTLNGLPFEQASASAQIRASVAMAMALKPTLRVLLVREGSLLAEDRMAMLAEMAEEHGFQVWTEVVDPSREGPGILIEDGEVAAIAEAAE